MAGRLLLLLVLSFIPCPVLATGQESDLVILEGKRFYTYSLARIEEVFPDISFPDFEMISTSNRKGYSTIWATFHKQLYLVGIEGRVAGNDELVGNNDILPDCQFPLKVTKWSGTIVQTDRSSSQDVDTMIWTDITETTKITVKHGLVTNTSVNIEQKTRKSADK
jgi:hypothetical protein